MTSGQSSSRNGAEDWPTFELTYTFDPDGICSARMEPDEVVIYDDGDDAEDEGRWISAKRNAYLPFEELR